MTAQIAGGATLQELFDAQTAAATGEIDPEVDVEVLGQMFVDAIAGSADRSEQLRALGEATMAADTVEPAVRRAVIEARLPNRLWPERELRIPAINAQTGELRVFGSADGVELIDAVGASCAVPGVWPVVMIEGDRYMDGGMASGSNVHLA
ncbi:patatin-like phospholipase family protein, partial [Rhodococcus erythropolis]|nr:patatin-like phospholipase family protein [Rhodococcus erythropolis]